MAEAEAAIKQFSTHFRLKADEYLRHTAYALFMQLIEESNVDTGALRHHWSISIGRPEDYHSPELRRLLLSQKRRLRFGTELPPDRPINMARSVLAEARFGNTIYINNLTTYLPYTSNYSRLVRLMRALPARVVTGNL